MTQRIQASELERLLSDDAVPDEAIAPYLKPAPIRSLPFQPMLAVDETRVAAPPSRGLIGLTVAALNARSNRQRQAAYQQRIAGGWQGLKILAEGDSWFQYPILLDDVIDNLSKDYAVYSVAAAGATMEHMLHGVAHLEQLIRANDFQALLFSGGGNDIAGDALLTYLRPFQTGAQPAPAYITETFAAITGRMQQQLEEFAGSLLKSFPQLHIFCHGYDWPFARNRGLWLDPAFTARQIPDTIRRPILKIMIDQYYGMLRQVAAKFPGRLHVVDCRGTVGEIDQWYDELHPMNAGFARAASRFSEEINQTFGILPTRGGSTRLAKISWRPHEEKSGARARSKLFPVGATVTIGRSAEREILLDDTRVSRSHARLTVGAGDIAIEDLDSSNGTLLDGKRIATARWLPGQKLRIGHYLLELEWVSQAAGVASQTTEPSSPAERPPAAVAEPSLPAAAAGLPAEAAPAAALGLMSPLAPLPDQAAISPQKLQIVIAAESITRQAAPAWAIGVFRNVNPVATRGSARAIDEALEGILSAVLESGQIDATLGKITMLPARNERGPVGQVILAGLGAISAFAPQVLEVIGESLARMLIATRTFELATVPIGGNAGLSVVMCVESFLTGFLRGLRQADQGHEFRQITFCEVNKQRHAQLAQHVDTLAGGKFFAAQGFDVAVAKTSETSEPRAGVVEAQGSTSPQLNLVYLEASSPADGLYDYSLLSPDLGAAISRYHHTVDEEARRQFALLTRQAAKFDAAFGASLASAYLPPQLLQLIGRSHTTHGGHLVVVHDNASSGIPWEAAYFTGCCPALASGVSRLYQNERLSSHGSRGRSPISPGAKLRILILQNPTADLAGAEKEANQLVALFQSNGGEVKVLTHEQCTHASVLAELQTGGYEILHYAGHAQFVEQRPEDSGIILRDGTLTAADMAEISMVPHLIFLNACESGRLRGAEEAAGDPALAQVGGQASLAEGFLRRGVANFIGTYWPVNDAAALTFATTFYRGLLAGDPLGPAVRAARKSIADIAPRDWANYLHFGDPAYVLRKLLATPTS